MCPKFYKNNKRKMLVKHRLGEGRRVKSKLDRHLL